jgi:mRNA-degrading endonuclease YafQ of YafQ-DinJ toxin-antitoxin module
MKYRFSRPSGFGKVSTLSRQARRIPRARLWKIFKENPFDPRLRSHKIHKLSARYSRTIYAAEIEANLRAVFYVEGDVVMTVDIGSHDIYRG